MRIKTEPHLHDLRTATREMQRIVDRDLIADRDPNDAYLTQAWAEAKKVIKALRGLFPDHDQPPV
jgi:hypothetical protein